MTNEERAAIGKDINAMLQPIFDKYGGVAGPAIACQAVEISIERGGKAAAIKAGLDVLKGTVDVLALTKRMEDAISPRPKHNI